MKALLILTAILEAATGLCLLAVPALLDWVLLGGRFEAAASIVVARIAGGALLALGIACWFASNDTRSRAAYGVVAAMLVYNVTVAALLVYAGAAKGASGIALWPAVVVHAALAVWCAMCLAQARASNQKGPNDTCSKARIIKAARNDDAGCAR